MKTLLMTGLLCLGVAGAFAEEREDTATYSNGEKAMTASKATVDAGVANGQSVSTASEALQSLRATHASQIETLELAISSAANHADRETIGREIEVLKETQQREEWQLLLAEADERGDAAYATRLREVLAPREPIRSTVTSLPIRDPETGEQIGETKGAQR